MFKPHEIDNFVESSLGKIEVQLRMMGLQAKEQLTALTELVASPLLYTIGKIGEQGASLLKKTRLGLPVGLAGALAPGVDSMISLFQADSAVARALVSQNKPAEVWQVDAQTLTEMGYPDGFAENVVGNRLYVGDSATNKEQSYFLLDQVAEESVLGPDAGIEPLWGLKDVNKVLEYVPGSDPAVDEIIANAHSKAIAEGYYFSPEGVTALRIIDTKLQPVASLVKGARRGGMENKIIDDTYLVFARVAGTGQAVVVLGKDEKGILTGYEGGDQGGKMFPLVFGSGDMSDVMGIYITLDGNQVFQPLIDTKTGEALIPSGEITSENSNEGVVLRKRARVSTVENYISPEYIALQDIAATSENYTINNGLIENNGVPVGGVRVDRNGVVWLNVEGIGEVQIDKSLLDFNSQELIVDGYAPDGEDEWVTTSETIVLGGVTLTLGVANENGIKIVTEMQVDGNYTDQQKSEKLAMIDPTNWGFEEGEAQIIKVGSEIFITPTGEPETRIAEWNFGKNGFIWDGEVMETYAGGNPIFEFAKMTDMNGGVPVDMSAAHLDSDQILNFASEEARKISGKKKIQPVYFFNGGDRSSGIVAWLIDDHLIQDPTNLKANIPVNAVVCFITSDGKLRSMQVRNFNVMWRGWN